MKANDKAQASPKAPAIDALLTAITGRSRVDAIESLTCATCGQDAQNKSFRDPLSWTEYTISGMCQTCQDSVFGP